MNDDDIIILPDAKIDSRGRYIRKKADVTEQHDIEQGSLEWYELRSMHFTASEAAGLVKMSPYTPKTPRQVLEVKQGARKVSETYPMKRGRELESRALAAFNEMAGVNCRPTVFTRGRMLASLDGYDPGTGVHVEIKCPMSDRMKTATTLPDHYKIQLAVQAYCCEPLKSYLMYWWEDGTTNLFEVEVEDLIQTAKRVVLPAVNEYAPYLISHTLPPLEPEDTEHREDKVWERAAQAYILAKAELDVFQKRFDEAKEELEKLAGGSTVEGCGVRVVSFDREGAVDWKKVVEELVPSEMLAEVKMDQFKRKSSRVTKITVEDES